MLPGTAKFASSGTANAASLQGQVEQQQQAFIEAAWGPLLSLLRQDARHPVPPNLQSDKAARQGIKDKWTAVNKALGEAQAQQVRGWGGGGRVRDCPSIRHPRE